MLCLLLTGVHPREIVDKFRMSVLPHVSLGLKYREYVHVVFFLVALNDVLNVLEESGIVITHSLGNRFACVCVFSR